MQRRLNSARTWRGPRSTRLYRGGYSTYTRGQRTVALARTGMIGGTVRRAIGNANAAATGTDRTDVALKGMLQIPVKVSVDGSGKLSESQNCGMVALPVWQLLQNTKYWNYYKDLFQQVGLAGFSAKITGNNAGSVVLASGLSSVTTFIGYDRNGIDGWVDDSDVKFDENAQAGSYENVYMVQYGRKQVSMKQKVMAAVSNGTVRQKAWSPGNAFYTHVSCFPSTLTEKQELVETDNMGITRVIKPDPDEVKWPNGDEVDDPPGKLIQIGFPSGLNSTSIQRMTKDWIVDETGSDGEIMSMTSRANFNTYVGEAGKGVEWDPVILIGVFNVPNTAAVNAEQVFTFTMDFTCMCSFRGTKDGVWDLGDNKSKSITLTGQALNLNVKENGIIQRLGQYNEISLNVNVPQNVSKQSCKYLNLITWNPRGNDTSWHMVRSFDLSAATNWYLLANADGSTDRVSLMNLGAWTLYIWVIKTENGNWRIISIYNASGTERGNFSPSAIFGISGEEATQGMVQAYKWTGGQSLGMSEKMILAVSSENSTLLGNAVSFNVGMVDGDDSLSNNTEFGEVFISDSNIILEGAEETLETLIATDENNSTQPDDLNSNIKKETLG